MLKPSPIPSPTSLVVKKGSKILSRFCGSIPCPLSRIMSRLLPFSSRPSIQTVGFSPSTGGLLFRESIEFCSKLMHTWTSLFLFAQMVWFSQNFCSICTASFHSWLRKRREEVESLATSTLSFYLFLLWD